MNRIIKIFTAFFLGIWMVCCSPEEHELEPVDVSSAELVEGIAFKIEHDQQNPNVIHLTSLMDGRYTPLWSHPQGRSQDRSVMLKIPFPGTYDVVFGVQTRGGTVYGDTVTFTVENLFADFIQDELWTLLSGGVGEEKTWYLDLDENGLSRYFAGPLYFYGTDDSWETVTEGKTVEGDSWNWQADYKGNTWMMDAANFGSMTFDLKGGANVKVIHNTISSRGTETGTYMIDTENHTMRLTDASPLHDTNRDGVVIDWGNIKIMSLTANTMQLAVLRDPVLSGEGPCLLVYNFISKDYFDNWVPQVEEPEPPYNGNANEDLTTSVSTTKVWSANLNAPYNWTNLSGNFLNEWTTNGVGTPVFTTWEPPYDEAALSKISLKLSKTGDAAGTFEAMTSDGTPHSGSYTIDSDNWIDFGQSIKFINALGGWLTVETDNGKMRIIRTEKDLTGNVSVLHLGRINPSNPNEYITLAMVPSGSGGDAETPGTEISFDNNKLIVGDLEGNGKLRLELYNDFGATQSDPPLNPAEVVVNQRISITFTLGGITLKDGAVGSYQTALGLADADWDPQYWGDGDGETTVTGNGTYTLWYEPQTTSDGAVVFVIDIIGLAADIEDLTTVTATIDRIEVW